MKKIFLILTTISLIAGVGCKKGQLDINTNPNQSTSADPSLVLPAALAVTVSNYYPGPTAFSEWMQSWAVSGSYAINANDPGTTYKMTTGYGDGLWQSVYDNLEDYQYIQTSANASGNGFLEGVARIMKAFNYMHLVDLWGDVPYSDALKGAASLRPMYDNGVDIYDSLFNELQTASTLIKNSGTTLSSNSDIMFGGDKTSWVQFANTIQLEMVLRMSQLSSPPAYFQTEVTAIQTEQDEDGFLTSDALVNPGYANSSGQANPFWQRFYNLTGALVSSFGDFWAANAYTITLLKNTNDPRLPLEYSPVAAGPNAGQEIGSTLGLANNNPTNGNYSIFGPGVLKGPGAPAVIMLASESYFLQAEAIALGYLPPNPDDDKTLYQLGIQASFEYLGLTDDDFNTWYTGEANNTKVDYATATTTLAKQTIILRQKWAALISINSFEAYDDYRKFDYLHTGTPPFTGPLGDTPPSASPYISVPKIPTRILYPQSEYSKNPDNTPALFDQQTSKIFWMQ